MAKNQTNKCAVCGRRGRRVCPAFAGNICPACCGLGRGSTIECPPECHYFPFGTEAYDLWLKVDDNWQPKALRYVIGKVGLEAFKSSAGDFAPGWLDREEALANGSAIALNFYLSVNEEGEPPLVETWEREGWPGLSNDERVMSRYRSQSLPAVLEVQRILNDTAVECIDRLDESRGKFIVFDRSTAGTVSRFANIVVWVTHYPHFTRLAGDGVFLANELVEPFLSLIRDRTRQEFGESTGEAVKRYLAGDFGEVYDLVESLTEERRKQLLASVDADRCVADYELRAPRKDIEAVLGEKPDFEMDEDYESEMGDPPGAAHYDWLRRGEAKRIEDQIPGLIRSQGEDDATVGGLGYIRVSDAGCRLTVMGRRKYEFAKELIVAYFEDKLELVNETITPIGRLMDESRRRPGSSRPEPSPAIPKDVEEQLMKKFYAQKYLQFLDEPVPMIDNLTPREAARIPSMRPKLIELIKLHLNHMDSMCAKKDFDIDIDWILDELGLDELRA
ncbi:MAG: hypothetical protein ABIA59_07515 [Candidatus Latescibacterota bacterium]